MTVIRWCGDAWRAEAPEPVGVPGTLLERLLLRADGGAVAFGIDCPIGLPRAYVARHLRQADFPAFLRALTPDAAFLQVASRLDEIGPARPFYPMRGVAGMTRLSHAQALGLADADALCRACDRATAERPAGAPVLWTLGANQSGKAAIAAWRDMLIPGLQDDRPVRLWPFEGSFRELLAPGRIAIAETYPAEAMQQLGVRRIGSKRRQADRIAYGAGLRAALKRLGAVAAPDLDSALASGFGADTAGEDRLDSLFGAACVLSVVTGTRGDTIPIDPWVRTWEGWVLGQAG